MQGTNGKDLPGKRYRPQFLWGQLVSWFKQTIYDPSASLSADRRGTLSLPDLESCYCQVSGLPSPAHAEQLRVSLDDDTVSGR